MSKFFVKETNYLSQRIKGLFASETIFSKEEILQCTGKEISLQEAIAKGELQSDVLQITDKKYIDLEEPGVFVNHSCNPNTGITKSLMLIAIRNISPGEEITYHDG